MLLRRVDVRLRCASYPERVLDRTNAERKIHAPCTREKRVIFPEADAEPVLARDEAVLFAARDGGRERAFMRVAERSGGAESFELKPPLRVGLHEDDAVDRRS